VILFLFGLDLTIGLREVAAIKNRSELLEAIVEKFKKIEAKTNFKESGRHLQRPHITLLDRTWIERIFDRKMIKECRFQQELTMYEEFSRTTHAMINVLLSSFSEGCLIQHTS